MTPRAAAQRTGRRTLSRAGTGVILAAALVWTADPSRADSLREAAEALEREDFASAIPYLEKALDEEPGNTNVRFNLAYALQSTGDADGAIRHYRAVAEQQPDLLPARMNLAGLLSQVGQFEAAAREYAVLADRVPEDPRLLELLASSHREARDYHLAAEAFDRLLTLEPESLEAILGLAHSLEAGGQLRDSVPYYLRAAAIDPQLTETLLVLAHRLEEAGHRQNAIEVYQEYARARPGNAAVQEEVGILLLEEDNVLAALDALERAVAAEPTFQRHAALAEAYRRSGDVGSAHEHLRMAASAAPDNAGARVRYATSLLQRQEFEAAAAEYRAAAEADGSAVDAWSGLAFALFQLGNFPATLHAIERSERLGPASPATIYLKALALDRIQDYELARAAYRAFLATRPEMPDEVWKAEQRLKAIETVLRKR